MGDDGVGEGEMPRPHVRRSRVVKSTLALATVHSSVEAIRVNNDAVVATVSDCSGGGKELMVTSGGFADDKWDDFPVKYGRTNYRGVVVIFWMGGGG